MFSKSDNVEVMIYDNPDEIIRELLDLFFSRYQVILETQMRRSIGRLTFSKLMEMGSLKIFPRKGGSGLRQNGEGLSRNGGVAILYWGFYRDSPWCIVGIKFWCVYLSFVNKHVL